MKGKDLQKICEQYPDFEFEFHFTDGYSKFPNIRSFNNLELCDIGHSDKVIILIGDEMEISLGNIKQSDANHDSHDYEEEPDLE